MDYQKLVLTEIAKQDPRSLVYIAAPYTARHPDGSYDTDKMEERIRIMSKCMGKLMTEYGVMSTSPLLMHLVRMHTKELPGDWSTWENYSTITMDKCDYMIVLDMEGMLESTGVTAERVHMENTGKPIFFLKVDEFLTPEPTLDALSDSDVELTPQLKKVYNDSAQKLKQVAARPKVHDQVIALRDGTSFKKGDIGLLIGEGLLDSENYYQIQLEDGRQIGPSLEDYWAKYTKE